MTCACEEGGALCGYHQSKVNDAYDRGEAAGFARGRDDFLAAVGATAALAFVSGLEAAAKIIRQSKPGERHQMLDLIEQAKDRALAVPDKRGGG